MHRDRLLVLELAGLPGAGKSTTLRAFNRLQDGRAGVETLFSLDTRLSRRDRFRQMADLAGFAARHPATASALAEFWARSTRCDLPSFRRVLRCWALAHRIDARRCQARGGALLLDQGFLQGIGSLSIPARSAAAGNVGTVTRLAMLDRIDGVIWLDCPPCLAAARRGSRSYGPICFGPENPEAQADLERFAGTVRSALASASSLGIPVLRLSAEDDAMANAACITDWISRLGAASDPAAARAQAPRIEAGELR